MPETAVNENYRPVSGKNYIGFSGKSFIRDPESVSQAMEHRADGQLWLRILSPDAGHIPAAFFRGQCIQARPSFASEYRGLSRQPSSIAVGARHCQLDDTATFCHLQICSCREMFAVWRPLLPSDCGIVMGRNE